MNIKELRTKLNWSQERLARELGVSVGTVHRWESGKVQPSRLAQNAIHQLEQAYNLTK